MCAPITLHVHILGAIYKSTQSVGWTPFEKNLWFATDLWATITSLTCPVYPNKFIKEFRVRCFTYHNHVSQKRVKMTLRKNTFRLSFASMPTTHCSKIHSKAANISKWFLISIMYASQFSAQFWRKIFELHGRNVTEFFTVGKREPIGKRDEVGRVSKNKTGTGTKNMHGSRSILSG